MQAPFIPRCQPSLHTKTRPNVAERWIVSVEKISSAERRADARAAQAKPERGDKKRAFPGVAVHKTGFEKQILWQLSDKGC